MPVLVMLLVKARPQSRPTEREERNQRTPMQHIAKNLGLASKACKQQV